MAIMHSVGRVTHYLVVVPLVLASVIVVGTLTVVLTFLGANDV